MVVNLFSKLSWLYIWLTSWGPCLRSLWAHRRYIPTFFSLYLLYVEIPLYTVDIEDYRYSRNGCPIFYLLIQSVFLISFIKWLMLFTLLHILRYHSQRSLSFCEIYWLFLYGYFIYFNKCLFFHIFVGHKFVHVRSNLLFSHSVVSNSLRPHELQLSRLPCPLLSPWVCSNSCALSPWCHPVISSSVTLFSSCLHSFRASRSFPVNWLFTSGGQSIWAWASALASVLPMNIQGWFPFGLTGLITVLYHLCSFAIFYSFHWSVIKVGANITK